MTDPQALRSEGCSRRDNGDLVGAADAFAAAAERYVEDGDSDSDLRGLVDVLCDWSEVLTLLGDPHTAAEKAAEAVAVLESRAMIGEHAVPTPEAARALLVFGSTELRSGEPNASVHIDAAVDIAKRLSVSLPTAQTRSFLAVALNQQSAAARRAGRVDDALGAATESVDIRRELAGSDPSQHAKALGSSLNNLAAVQAERQDMLAAAQSAVEACRVLGEVVDGGDLEAAPNLAAAQSNAAAFLGDLAELDLALQFGAEAVKGYQALTARYPPPAFVPELARAMLVLATCVAGQDRFEIAADLCHSALAVLLTNADRLASADRAVVPEILAHYQVFATTSGQALDADLVDAAVSALTPDSP